MKYLLASLALISAAPSVIARPVVEPFSKFIPGQTPFYTTYKGKVPPFPGNITGAILPTSKGKPGPDDLLFQNLLSAEWIVYSLYQQAVEAFNASTFTKLGFPNTTYDRITEIRDNEAGHLNIFYNEISDASVKPGPCRYDYGFSNAEEWLAIQVLVELSSMAFLTGLVQEARTDASRAALVAIAEVESRHNAWALIDIWNTSPFSGPSDTVFPYAKEILGLTNSFVINGSCPAENPPYPRPNQHLPGLDFNGKKSTGHVGSEIELVFPDGKPKFVDGKKYYVVYFHGLFNISEPFNPAKPTSTVPAAFDAGVGLIEVVIADQEGAPTLDSVLAGPLTLLQQPARLTSVEP